MRRRDGVWVAIEHKRGRCRRDDDGHPQAWPSDRIQAIAYAVLLEEGLAEPVPQARVRYHADGVTAFVEIDEVARRDLDAAVERARELRRSTQRPPVAENENLCPRCSLAPVCLPEEERLAQEEQSPEEKSEVGGQRSGTAEREPPRLFPSRREQQTLHIVSPRADLGRSGTALLLTNEDEKQKIPVEQIDSVVIHGYGQVSTQAIHLCAQHGVAVQWFTMGGKFAAGTAFFAGPRAAADPPVYGPGRPRHAARSGPPPGGSKNRHAAPLRAAGKPWRGCRPCLVPPSTGPDTERACRRAQGRIGRDPAGTGRDRGPRYSDCLRVLIDSGLPEELRPDGRNRRPPRDRFNCLLSFGYALLQSLVHRTLLAVGLEPALGFYHQPRTAAPPLVLDLMELFRTLLWDIPLIGSLNRGQWNAVDDFSVTPGQVWLSDAGRRKAIELFEQRLTESYQHPHTGQSLSYARIVELETRLLEKEWTGCPGLFGHLRLR